MRHFYLLTLALGAGLGGAARAETIAATSQVTAVTLYPEGAQVTREITFAAPPGAHDLVITDLPAAILAQSIRLSSPDATLGAFALRSDRLPPRPEATSPAREAAKARVADARTALDQARQAVNAIAAEVEAQQAQIGFLTGLRLDSGQATAASLTEIAQMIQSRVLAARQTALSAQSGLPAAQERVARAQETLAQAEGALAALSRGDDSYAALSVAVTSTGTGGHLTLTHLMQEASWAPVYDMTLDRKAARVTVERGILVSQSTGEDWEGVALTLSTARPSAQSQASTLYPDLRRIAEPEPKGDVERAEGDMVGMAAPMVAPAPMSASLDYQGETLVYHYPVAVDVASEVENLRLALDRLQFDASLRAQAVPRRDATAYLQAEMTNQSQEILLPGTAYLSRDGALIGATDLPVLAPGAKTSLGFGAIEGLKLTRDMPLKSQGDRGMFIDSTQLDEKAVLKIENLTAEPWPVRLIDQVPYSEQEDLEISFSATPEPSHQDLDGQRGILAWDFDLGPHQTREIQLDSRIRWPQGKRLE